MRVRDVLVAALPELRAHLLQEGIRTEWSTIVGPEISRRSQPGELRAGVLDVAVDNSPWLHELTLRSSSLLATLQARYGPEVTALRLALRPIVTGQSPVAPRRRQPAPRTDLGPAEARLVESVVAPVADPALAASIRRLVTKDLLARQADPGQRPPDQPSSERGDS